MLIDRNTIPVDRNAILMNRNGITIYWDAILTDRNALLMEFLCGEGVSSFWGDKVAVLVGCLNCD